MKMSMKMMTVFRRIIDVVWMVLKIGISRHREAEGEWIHTNDYCRHNCEIAMENTGDNGRYERTKGFIYSVPNLISNGVRGCIVILLGNERSDAELRCSSGSMTSRLTSVEMVGVVHGQASAPANANPFVRNSRFQCDNGFQGSAGRRFGDDISKFVCS